MAVQNPFLQAMELIHGIHMEYYKNAALFQRINGEMCILIIPKWNNETENNIVGDRDLSWQQEREGKWWWEVDKAMIKIGMHQNLVLLDKWTLLFLSTFPFHFSQAMKQSHVIICPKKDLFGIEVLELENLKTGGELSCHMQRRSLLSNNIILDLPHHTCSSSSSSSSDTNLSLMFSMLLSMMMMMLVEIFHTELVLLIKQQRAVCA